MGEDLVSTVERTGRSYNHVGVLWTLDGFVFEYFAA